MMVPIKSLTAPLRAEKLRGTTWGDWRLDKTKFLTLNSAFLCHIIHERTGILHQCKESQYHAEMKGLVGFWF